MASPLPLALRGYRTLTRVATPFVPLWMRRRQAIGKEDAARADERRGISAIPRPPGALVWIHGASVGEVLAAAALIDRLRALNLNILVTSGTVTSAEVIAKRFPSEIVHQYIPYDSPLYVARFLDHWKPNLALFVESDIWPNLVLTGAARRLSMILVNGRMSPRSFPRWRRLPSTIGALLSTFDLCLAQSTADAQRFSELGGRNVTVTGNLKLDVAAPPADDGRLLAVAVATRGRPVLIAASTHPGEDEIVLEAHQGLRNFFPSLLTVIVPRHPARGPAIAALCTAARAKVAVRSRDELPDAETDIYVADTMGELGLFYRLSPVVVMGGSFVKRGGQNPIEAIKLGAAVVHGPHVFNFADVYSALDRAGGARQINDMESLIRQLGQWIANEPARRSVVDTGQRVVDQLGGGLDRTLAALEPYLLQLRLERGDDA
jgi:3-deoxy-D-manno-octulosonic-acid transferase